jgi:hypothetical protein
VEYRIATQTVTKEATPGKFYLDADDDLFLYMGDDRIEPWLEINDTGAYDRNSSYPKEPLTEVDRKDCTSTISRKLLSI